MIKNTEIAIQISQVAQTLSELAVAAHTAVAQEDFFQAQQLLSDALFAAASLKFTLIPFVTAKELTRALDKTAENVEYSIKNLELLLKARSPLILNKIEFEWLPLIEDFKVQFEYFAFYYPNEERMAKFDTDVRPTIPVNPYIDESAKTGKYTYDISIVVLGYNNLCYTKMCVKSLLQYMPKNLRYELILINHGSSDGTKKYFSSICPTKHIDILNNLASPTLVSRIAQGRYLVMISNDVVVTQNAIENLYTCINSDEEIAWVVPSTSNISNYQSLDIHYKTLEEMDVYAKKHNVSNPLLWEQRVRLCNPIDIKRTQDFYTMGSPVLTTHTLNFNQKNALAFPDDTFSLALRRSGKKIVLAKDTYCHHFGSVTIKDLLGKQKDTQKVDPYIKGREQFMAQFGVDPWGTGFCYNYELFQTLPFQKTGHVDILGLNCGLGSNPLKVRENLKNRAETQGCHLFNAIDDQRFESDLKGVSDEVAMFKTKQELFCLLKKKKYDYIIWEDALNLQIAEKEVVQALIAALKEGGVLAISRIGKNVVPHLAKENTTLLEEWVVYQQK